MATSTIEKITPADIGAVAINQTVKMTNQNIDLTKTNNNISTDAWMAPIAWADKNSKEYADVQGIARSNGTTSLYIGVRNFDTDGNAVTNKGIYLNADKSGNLSYSFADPQNARSALGITPANIGAVKDGGAVSTADLNENSIRYLGADSSNSGVGYGTLLTMTNGSDRRSQLFIQASDTSAPIRVRSYSGNSWSSWHTVYKDNTTVPVTAGGTGATSKLNAVNNFLTVVTGTLTNQSINAGQYKDFTFSFPDTTQYEVICVCGYNIPGECTVYDMGYTSRNVISLHNVSTSNLSGKTLTVKWLCIKKT